MCTPDEAYDDDDEVNWFCTQVSPRAAGTGLGSACDMHRLGRDEYKRQLRAARMELRRARRGAALARRRRAAVAA